jgi:hypothetical protein
VQLWGKWCAWIAYCISFVQFLVLINGSLEGFFGSSRGLWQGDPLSPLLFVFLMEALSCMMSVTLTEGLIEGLQVGNVTISHLFFADDTLILCKACPIQLSHLRSILLLFEAPSGLKANLAKSELILVGNVPHAGSLARILGCRVSTLPAQCLGLLLGTSHKASHIWDGVIEKIDRRLAG